MQEVENIDCKNNRESMHNQHAECGLDNSPTENSSISQIARDLFSSESTFSSFIKFMMCFGLLTLQDSQPAVAATDFGSGLQSIPFLGDLGDISTGFASVRKTSL